MQLTHFRHPWPIRTLAVGALGVAAAFGIGAAVQSTLADASPIPPTAFKVCISEKGTWRALPSFQQCKSAETLVELALYEDVSQLHTDLLGEEGARESADADLQALIEGLGDGGDLSALQAQLTALAGTVATGDAALQAQLTALAASVASGDGDLQAELSALQAQLTAESQATAGALANLQANIAGVEANLVAAIADGDAALQNQLQALQADLQSVMAQVNGLTAENQDQAAQISQLNQALGNETAARQAADVNLANQINQLGSAISSIQSVNAQQAAAITDHEARLDALEALVLP